MILEMEQLNYTSVGFIFSHPRPTINSNHPVDNKVGIIFNQLLTRLNIKYPDSFPHNHWSYYKIIYAYAKENKDPKLIDLKTISDLKNLDRIKNEIQSLDTVICFGEKAHFVMKKVNQLFLMNIKLVKTKEIAYPISRHVKMSNQQSNNRVRTNYQVLTQFKEIEKQLNNS